MNYILDFKDSMTFAEVTEYLIVHSMTLVKQYGSFGNVFLVTSNTLPEPDDDLLSVVLDESSGIQLLDLDVTITQDSTESTFNINDDKNWWKVASISTVDFDVSNYTHTVCGQHSTVYILDSGITLDHPEFVDANITLLHSITGDFVDRKGHGTGMASLISGKTCGLTASKLKIVKIFDLNMVTLQSDLLGAFDAVLLDYINNGKKPSVVNLSWGIAKNIYLNAKIEQMIDAGMFVIAASGNSGIPIGDVTPASIPAVLTVGSFGQNLTPSNFSNYTGGSTISYTASETNEGALDGWAPGELIWVAGLNGTYGYAAGTSVAAAIASGALAYNFAKFADDNGDSPSEFVNYADSLALLTQLQKQTTDARSYSPTPFWYSTITKTNLLNLSDPKYSNSINRIVTYGADPSQLLPKQKVIAVSGQTTHKLIASRYIVARMITTQSIPDYITIDNRGIVTVVAPVITEIMETVTPIEFILHLRDGSVTTLTLNVFITRADVNKNNIESLVPAGDPLIQMFTYYACSYGCSPDCPGGCGGYPSGKYFICGCY
jgi:hypothetical protein